MGYGFEECCHAIYSSRDKIVRHPGKEGRYHTSMRNVDEVKEDIKVLN